MNAKFAIKHYTVVYYLYLMMVLQIEAAEAADGLDSNGDHSTRGPPNQTPLDKAEIRLELE